MAYLVRSSTNVLLENRGPPIDLLQYLVNLCPANWILRRTLGYSVMLNGDDGAALDLYDTALDLELPFVKLSEIDGLTHSWIVCVGCKMYVRGYAHICTIYELTTVCCEEGPRSQHELSANGFGIAIWNHDLK